VTLKELALMNSLPLSAQRLENITVLSLLVILSAAFCLFGPRPGQVNLQTASSARLAPFTGNEKLDPDLALALKVVGEHTRARQGQSVATAMVDEPTVAEALAPTPERIGTAAPVVSHVIKPGETLFNIWKHYGAPKTGGTKAAEAWRQAGITLQSLRPGDELKLTIENGDISEIRRTLRNGDEVVLKGNSKAGYVASVRKVRIVETQRNASGIISTSFSASARSAGVPYAIIDELVDLFGGRIEFRRDLHPGDSFTVSFTQRSADGVVGDIDTSISAASIHRGGVMYAVVRYVGKDGQVRYFNEDGEPVGNYFLRYPLQFSRISSVFSNARLHPVLQRLRPHKGVDFAAPVGTPVRAVADGVVADAGYRGGAGNMIQIEHNSRYSTAYLHLSKILPAVHRGAHVTRGQVIGAVGMTGLASGPHLHFSLFDHGQYVDPQKVALPTLAANHDRIPQQVLVTALSALRASQESLMLAMGTSANKVRKLG
jgi:murein DD-endopeptidase MepM/ murein hydrolase activator NlpD